MLELIPSVEPDMGLKGTLVDHEVDGGAIRCRWGENRASLLAS